MNGTLQFTIDLIVLTIGTFGSCILGYVGLKIMFAIADGRLDPVHLVSDKGANFFSISKVGQAIGMLALTIAFVYIITHTDYKVADIGNWIYWLFAAYGTIMILPQAWTNFLNQSKPPQLPGTGTRQTEQTTVTKTAVNLPAAAEEPK